MKRQDFYMALALIVFGVITRALPHPANVTALGALAIWAPFFIQSRLLAFAIPLFTLVVSDLFLGAHSTQAWVIAALALSTALSLALQSSKSTVRAFLATLCGSLIFFMVSNLGVWWTGDLYPASPEGFVHCYLMALPFLKNQLLGDMAYSTLLSLVIHSKWVASRIEA